MKTDRIYYGAAYYDEYMPCERIREDMRMLREAGMNVIRIAESTWATMEPHDGVFDFTHLDRMLEASAAEGILVILGTPTYAIPAWMAARYPDILAVTRGGQEIYGRRQNMDITSPDYLRHAERIIRRMLEHVKDAAHIIGFQLDNETKSYDTRGPRVQAMFASYLKEQFHGDLSALNDHFGFNYWSNRISAWEDLPNVTGTINGSFDAEFRKFQRKLAADFLKWQAAIVEEYRRPDQFVTQNFDFDWRGCSYGLQPDIDQVSAAQALTVAGVDIYHKSAAELDGAAIHMGGAIGRSLKKDNYLVLETEAQGNPGWLPYRGQLRLQAYSHLACGANSVMYWHWHSIHNAIETYWKGVLSHNLKRGAVYDEACTIGRELSAIGGKLKNLKKENRAAFLLSQEALIGLQEFPISGALQYNEVFRWLFDALYRLNIEADVIYERNMIQPGCADSYDTIFVPALYSVKEETLSALRRFTKQGGQLIASFKSFFSDEYLKVFHDDQPHGMTDVFGMTYDRFTIPTKETVTFRADALRTTAVSADRIPAASRTETFQSDTEITPDSAAEHAAYGSPIPVREWMELLEPAGAETLASYETAHWGECAAVTRNQFGKGTAVYIGCYFDSDVLEKLLASLMSARGFDTDGPHFPLIRKCGKNDDGNRIIYLLNYSDAPIVYTHRGADAQMLLPSGIGTGIGNAGPAAANSSAATNATASGSTATDGNTNAPSGSVTDGDADTLGNATTNGNANASSGSVTNGEALTLAPWDVIILEEGSC
ncbi:MAG: beta-galactosidase [Clostridium sp.]|nr:beta-galactosidase [Clostridium sp.]